MHKLIVSRALFLKKKNLLRLLVPHGVCIGDPPIGCGFRTPPRPSLGVFGRIPTVTLTGFITVAIVFDGFLRTKTAAFPEVVPIYTIITFVLDVLLV